MQKVIKTDLGEMNRVNEYEDVYKFLDFGSDFGELHYGFPINIESLRSFYSNPASFSQCLVYGYFDNCKNLKSAIWYNKDYDPRVNKKLLTEFLWLSKDPKYSIRLLSESLDHINLYYKYDALIMGNVTLSKKLDSFYVKKGFTLDSKSYYKKFPIH